MKQKTKKPNLLIVHLGTAFVEGALITDSDEEGALFLDNVERVAIGFGSSRVRGALLEHTVTALKKLLNKYVNEKVSSIKIVLSSPWYHANVRTIQSSSETTALITTEAIIETVQKYQDQQPPKSGREDLEAVAIQVEVNGYPTTLQRGAVEGKLVKIHLYESEIDSDIKRAFLAVASSIFPHNQTSLYSFPLAYTLSLRESTEEQNFIALEVGAEVSDVVIVHHDAIQYIASIPIGYYSIARSFGGVDAEDSVADSLSKLTLYARGELSSDEAEKVKSILDTVFVPWQSEFETMLTKASAHTAIPRAIFLLSDKAQIPWISEGIKLRSEKSHKIIPVTEDIAKGRLTIGEKGSYNTTLSLLSIFFKIATDEIFGSSDAKTKENKQSFLRHTKNFS